jgi:hypothetical protein
VEHDVILLKKGIRPVYLYFFFFLIRLQMGTVVAVDKFNFLLFVVYIPCLKMKVSKVYIEANNDWDLESKDKERKIPDHHIVLCFLLCNFLEDLFKPQVDYYIQTYIYNFLLYSYNVATMFLKIHIFIRYYSNIYIFNMVFNITNSVKLY